MVIWNRSSFYSLNVTNFGSITFTHYVHLIQVVLLNVYDVMIKAVMVVPRVETKLYSEWVSWQTITYSIGVLW